MSAIPGRIRRLLTGSGRNERRAVDVDAPPATGGVQPTESAAPSLGPPDGVVAPSPTTDSDPAEDPSGATEKWSAPASPEDPEPPPSTAKVGPVLVERDPVLQESAKPAPIVAPQPEPQPQPRRQESEESSAASPGEMAKLLPTSNGDPGEEVRSASGSRSQWLIVLMGVVVLLAVLIAAAAGRLALPTALGGKSGGVADLGAESSEQGGTELDAGPVRAVPITTTSTFTSMTTTTVTSGSPESWVCSGEAAIPEEESPRVWKTGVAWRRVCERKNRHTGFYPFGHNWCWIGFKNICHAHLKDHKTWSDMQTMGADEGVIPPVKERPFHPLQHPQVCDRPELGQAPQISHDEFVTAASWFHNNVRLYVLNLPADTQRWGTISARISELGLTATRVEGVDMRVPGALWVAKHAGWVPAGYDFKRAQESANSYQQMMGTILGTLGCASGHFKATAKAQEDGAKLAVVLEDDSFIEADFVARLWHMVGKELPCDWEVVTLMSRCPYGRCVSPHLARVQPDANEPAWSCRHGVNWGMHGVLYRVERLPDVRKIWQRTVFDEERPHCLDVDIALASISDQVKLYAVPASQSPGFLRELDAGSSRFSINNAGTQIT